jgi:hypothetical protein
VILKEGRGRPLVSVDICPCREKESFINVIFDKLMWNTYSSVPSEVE